MIRHHSAPRASGTVETLHQDEVGGFRWCLLGRGQSISFMPKPSREYVVACLGAPCRVEVGGESHRLEEKDLIYVPRGGLVSRAEPLLGSPTLLVIGEAEAGRELEPYVKRFSEVEGFTSGFEGYRRDIYVAIGEEDPADRLMAGFTEGWPGEWTSYPPHSHEDKAEMYVYYGLGGRSGLQIVETVDCFRVYRVRDWDAVIFTEGYHPNLPEPGARICYLWILYQVAGERGMRVTIHPDYRDVPIGRIHFRER